MWADPWDFPGVFVWEIYINVYIYTFLYLTDADNIADVLFFDCMWADPWDYPIVFVWEIYINVYI